MHIELHNIMTNCCDHNNINLHNNCMYADMHMQTCRCSAISCTCHEQQSIEAQYTGSAVQYVADATMCIQYCMYCCMAAVMICHAMPDTGTALPEGRCKVWQQLRVLVPKEHATVACHSSVTVCPMYQEVYTKHAAPPGM
jgi:hypothetical protein